MINIHHEGTDTRFETSSGNVGGDTPWLQTQTRTRCVDTSTTVYDSDLVGVWSSQSIHLQEANGDVYAYVENRAHDRGAYLVVKLDQHDTLFVPIEIGQAIADALAAKAVAS